MIEVLHQSAARCFVARLRAQFVRFAQALVLLFFASLASAQATLPPDVTNAIRKAFGPDEIRYFESSVDLDGDGKMELLVYVVGPTVCGSGGCSLLVFTPGAAGNRLVSKISVTQTPISVSDHMTSAWRDLIVRIGGGGAKAADVALSFNGKSYPANPTVPGPHVKPATGPGAKLLIGEFKSMADGKLLAAATPTTSSSPPAATGPSAATTSPSSAPSFDCAKAGTPVEKLICTDQELAAKDRTLAAAYAKGTAPTSNWTDADRNASRTAQRQWIVERNACARQNDVKSCVTSAYGRRIATLRIQNGEVEAPTALEYKCKGLANQPVAVSIYDKLDPQTAVVTVGDRQVFAFRSPSGGETKFIAPKVEFRGNYGEATMQWFGKSYTCLAV